MTNQDEEAFLLYLGSLTDAEVDRVRDKERAAGHDQKTLLAIADILESAKLSHSVKTEVELLVGQRHELANEAPR